LTAHSPELAATPRRSRARVVKVLALLVGAVLMAIGGTYGWWTIAEHRLVTISPGKVYQSAEIPPTELSTIAKANGWKSVIDLRDTRPDAIAAEKTALDAIGVRHLHVPSLQEPTTETIDRVLDLMGDPANQPLLLHCEHGEGRSVLLAALYRMRHEGWTADAAWRGSARLPSVLGFLARWFPGLATFKPDSPKGRILFDYGERAR
jgi:protein tyrosine phosphatase (PTP) superfamily phosphohydrolase (DUF442 family)